MKLKNVIRFCLGIGLGVLITMSVNKETPTEIKTEVSETEVTTETNYVYVICDVVDYYGDELCDYAINLVCKMPNGTLHTYVIEDPPAEAELVCFRTDNQDDYSNYEVVAVR